MPSVPCLPLKGPAKNDHRQFDKQLNDPNLAVLSRTLHMAQCGDLSFLVLQEGCFSGTFNRRSEVPSQVGRLRHFLPVAKHLGSPQHTDWLAGELKQMEQWRH